MITEDQLEQLCLEWFQSISYDYVCGYDIAPDGAPSSGRCVLEHRDYRQIILPERLLSRLQSVNSKIRLRVKVNTYFGVEDFYRRGLLI